MNNLFKLAGLLDPGPNGEPPGIVWIFVGLWVFLMVGIPVILGIKSLREKQRKAEQAADEARRKMLSGENETPARAEERRADTQQSFRDRITSTLARVSPEIRQRLDDKKAVREQKERKEQYKAKDNLRGQLKPHGHKDENEQKGLYGSLDYCEYEDYFFDAATAGIEADEISNEEHHVDLSMLTDDELTLDEAAELMILGDILNNPSYKRK